MIDKIKSLKWRFPAKDDPPAETGGLILNTNDLPLKKETPMPQTAKTAYPVQRRYPRYPLKEMDIHVHMVITEEVDLQNISINGACIHTQRRLQPGKNYLLTMWDEKMPRSLKCTAVWIRAIPGDDARQEYIAGLRFQSIASDELVRLKDFMRNFGTPVETRISDEFAPSPLRFTVTAHAKAYLKCPKILHVRTISLGGMLIESDIAPDLGTHYLMNLPLPHEAEPIMIRGRIASILPQADGSRSHFDVGIDFHSIEDADKARLDAFLHTL